MSALASPLSQVTRSCPPSTAIAMAFLTMSSIRGFCSWYGKLAGTLLPLRARSAVSITSSSVAPSMEPCTVRFAGSHSFLPPPSGRVTLPLGFHSYGKSSPPSSLPANRCGLPDPKRYISSGCIPCDGPDGYSLGHRKSSGGVTLHLMPGI